MRDFGTVLQWGTLVCAVLTVIIRFVALVDGNWVEYSVSNTELIEMSLFSCSNCPLFHENWGWSCFRGQFCDLTPAATHCTAFKSGYISSFIVNSIVRWARVLLYSVFPGFTAKVGVYVAKGRFWAYL